MSPSKNSILIGCSGWSYADWEGPFYPEGMASGEYLGWYADRFPIVEVDSTFYRVPSKGMVEGWRRKTPAGFKFALKVPQVITHQKQLRDCEAEVDEFVASILPLGEKLSSALLQLGYFNRGAFASLDDFLGVLDPFLSHWPHDRVPLAVEVRNPRWVGPQAGRGPPRPQRRAHLDRADLDAPTGEGLRDDRPGHRPARVRPAPGRPRGDREGHHPLGQGRRRPLGRPRRDGRRDPGRWPSGCRSPSSSTTTTPGIPPRRRRTCEACSAWPSPSPRNGLGRRCLIDRGRGDGSGARGLLGEKLRPIRPGAEPIEFQLAQQISRDRDGLGPGPC